MSEKRSGLRETLAEYAHDAWSSWMKYMESKILPGCYHDGDQLVGGWVPIELRDRWERQMNTPYADLPEEEKESDRAEADKILSVLQQHRPRVIFTSRERMIECAEHGWTVATVPNANLDAFCPKCAQEDPEDPKPPRLDEDEVRSICRRMVEVGIISDISWKYGEETITMYMSDILGAHVQKLEGCASETNSTRNVEEERSPGLTHPERESLQGRIALGVRHGGKNILTSIKEAQAFLRVEEELQTRTRERDAASAEMDKLKAICKELRKERGEACRQVRVLKSGIRRVLSTLSDNRARIQELWDGVFTTVDSVTEQLEQVADTLDWEKDNEGEDRGLDHQ